MANHSFRCAFVQMADIGSILNYELICPGEHLRHKTKVKRDQNRIKPLSTEVYTEGTGSMTYGQVVRLKP